jgi:hypothetical protein
MFSIAWNKIRYSIRTYCNRGEGEIISGTLTRGVCLILCGGLIPELLEHIIRRIDIAGTAWTQRWLLQESGK